MDALLAGAMEICHAVPASQPRQNTGAVTEFGGRRGATVATKSRRTC